MKVVTNSTPLIALSKINRLELLQEVYRSIYIPEVSVVPRVQLQPMIALAETWEPATIWC